MAHERNHQVDDISEHSLRSPPRESQRTPLYVGRAKSVVSPWRVVALQLV